MCSISCCANEKEPPPRYNPAMCSVSLEEWGKTHFAGFDRKRSRSLLLMEYSDFVRVQTFQTIDEGFAELCVIRVVVRAMVCVDVDEMRRNLCGELILAVQSGRGVLPAEISAAPFPVSWLEIKELVLDPFLIITSEQRV